MSSYMKKTNAARLLDAKSINYELAEYEVNENDLSAVSLAKKIGQDVEQIFKTLVLRGDKTGVFVCVVPGDTEVDLKKAAKVSGNKNCAMVHQKGIARFNRLHSRRVFSFGHEKTVPDIHTRNLPVVRFDIY